MHDLWAFVLHLKAMKGKLSWPDLHNRPSRYTTFLYVWTCDINDCILHPKWCNLLKCRFNDLVSSYESRLINAVGWIVRYAFKETNISALPYGSYTLRWTDIISIMIMKLNDFSSLQIDNKSISFFIIEKTTNAWQHNQWYHHLFLISR